MSRRHVTSGEGSARRVATRVLAALAVVAIAAGAAALPAAAAPPPSRGAGAPGNVNGELGLVGMDDPALGPA